VSSPTTYAAGQKQQGCWKAMEGCNARKLILHLLGTAYLAVAMAAFNRIEASFFTATILEWKHLLKQDKYKDIVVDSISYLVKCKRVEAYGVVIMNNHLHLIWNLAEGPLRD
jgi:hypothetical protein